MDPLQVLSSWLDLNISRETENQLNSFWPSDAATSSTLGL